MLIRRMMVMELTLCWDCFETFWIYPSTCLFYSIAMRITAQPFLMMGQAGKGTHFMILSVSPEQWLQPPIFQVISCHIYCCRGKNTRINPTTTLSSFEGWKVRTSELWLMELPGQVTVSAVPHACPQGRLVLQNNLQAAIEAQLGEEVQVLYPHRCHEFESVGSDTVIKVCLRDDPSICGTCSVTESSLPLRTSDSFGRFGHDAEEYLQKETEEVQREQDFEDLLQKRKQVLPKKLRKLNNEITFVVSAICIFGLLAGSMVAGLVLSDWEPEDAGEAGLHSFLCIVLLGAFAFAAWTCTGLGPSIRGIWIVKCLAYNSGLALYLLGALGIAAAVARYVVAGFWWSALIVGPPLCCMLVLLCRKRCKHSLPDWVQISKMHILQSLSERNIAFKGRVLPRRKCICSWPGKYESAWDSLVQSSRGGKISAAVVFLPAGSKNFGLHDDYEASCWCVPLYGEKKPWGCRWWSKWMANVEQAVRLGVELEVYFFKGMKGKGKVGNFLTAGIEHLRREAIQSKQADFLNSQVFQVALDAGIDGLCKEFRGDSSSQYSREVHRLFLASLPEEDRTFMMASEGLGNSQKAEVAWLEFQGYAYTEVEVDPSAWRPPSIQSPLHSESGDSDFMWW